MVECVNYPLGGWGVGMEVRGMEIEPESLSLENSEKQPRHGPHLQ